MRTPASSLVKRISGPVSMHTFKLPHSAGEGHNDVIILGDVHFSYHNQCPKCKKSEGCTSIVDFIDHKARQAIEENRKLDVYLEMPYVPSTGKLRASMLKTVDNIFRADTSLGAAFGRLFEKDEIKLIGIFSTIYKRYHRLLYPRVGIRPPDSMIRFHYCDTRMEPNAFAMFMSKDRSADFIKFLFGRPHTSQTIRAILHTFIFSTNFPADLEKCTSKPIARRLLIASSLSSLVKGGKRTVHKVAKQYHLLPEGLAKTAVYKYVGDRIDYVIKYLKKEAMCDEIHDLLSELDVVDSIEIPVADFASHMRTMKVAMLYQLFSVVMKFFVPVILMDTYLLCRLLRYAHAPSPTNGTSIIYVGDAHAQYFVHFLKDYMHVEPLSCFPRKDDNRCVTTHHACGHPIAKRTPRLGKSATKARGGVWTNMDNLYAKKVDGIPWSKILHALV